MATAGTCGGYGSAPFGAMPFGAGGSGIVGAQQQALNAVDVTFLATHAPKAFDPAALDDALNRANWRLEAFDPFDATLRLAQRVEALSPTVLRVFLDGRLTSTATYIIEISARVVDTLGVGLLCRCAEFVTFKDRRRERRVELQDQPQDIANPFTVRDAPTPNAPLGTYQISDVGDFGRDSGEANLRKRILRRGSVKRGSFFHLPNYGFLPDLKGRVLENDLKVLALDAQGQCRQEPDVRNAQVKVESTVPGLVIYRIKVQPVTGEAFTMVFPREIPS